MECDLCFRPADFLAIVSCHVLSVILHTLTLNFCMTNTQTGLRVNGHLACYKTFTNAKLMPYTILGLKTMFKRKVSQFEDFGLFWVALV